LENCIILLNNYEVTCLLEDAINVVQILINYEDKYLVGEFS